MTLNNCETIAFLATTQPAKTRAFYCDLLGLSFVEDNPFALVIQTANALLRIQKVHSFTPLPFTALGWRIENIHSAAAALATKGVQFERFAGMTQDEQGIWLS